MRQSTHLIGALKEHCLFVGRKIVVNPAASRTVAYSMIEQRSHRKLKDGEKL